MKLQASVLNILVSIFRLGLLALLAGTYEATSPQLLMLSVIWNDFDVRSFSLVMFRKRFSLV